jgi:tetratricopeptide (TPR) repeat protein/predicted Ser/Thr protein kinase
MNEPLPDPALRRLLAAAAEAPADAPPPVPARFRIEHELGRGGMGVVYAAFDTQLGRRCAIKVLGAALGPHDALRARFAREALAAARLQHPHIAAVYDATPDWIAMQLVDGAAIDTLPRTDRRRLVRLVRDAARALQHAHDQGLVHRDLKPSNLLVEGDHVYVVDFGLAKALDAEAPLSVTGAVVGTPAYMPPEQALGRAAAVDARSDVYGLGATLFHCLAGAPPFAAADLPGLLRLVVEQDPKPTGVDRGLDLVLAKCLAKEPAQRYASMQALAEDLDRWLADEPVLARPPSLRYRWQQRWRRQRALWRAAMLAVAATALVLVPIALRASAARAAADAAVELADHVAAVQRQAALFVGLGDRDSAWQVLEQGIAHTEAFLRHHDVPRVRWLLSRLLRQRGRNDAALAELERALAAAPTLADARFERGLLLAAVPELDAATRALALADLATALPAQSVVGDVERLLGRAEAARLQGDHRRALALLQEVLAYDGTHIGARLALSRAALAVGDTDLARYHASGALDLQQGHAPFYLARERRTLPTAMLGLDGVLVDYAESLRDSPDHALAFAHRGLVQLRRALRLHDEGRPDAARAAVQAAIDDHGQALAVHDRLAGARNNRAVCLLVADRLAAAAGDSAAAAAFRAMAVADLAIAVEVAPTLPAVHANLGHVAHRSADVLRALARAGPAAGEADKARAAFTRALALAPPDWPHAAACRERLRALGD